jgi:hypothetical protein
MSVPNNGLKERVLFVQRDYLLFRSDKNSGVLSHDDGRQREREATTPTDGDTCRILH